MAPSEAPPESVKQTRNVLGMGDSCPAARLANRAERHSKIERANANPPHRHATPLTHHR
jgi:hypothetical protein